MYASYSESLIRTTFNSLKSPDCTLMQAEVDIKNFLLLEDFWVNPLFEISV